MKRLLRQLKHRLLKSNALLTTLPSVSAYAHWARHYPPHAHNRLMETEEQAMLMLFPALKGAFVLDLACGSGRYSRIAIEQGASHVLGVDNSLEMLMVGKDAITSTQVGFALGTTEAIPMSSDSVDVVLCGLALGHIPSLDQSLQEIARVLKPKGTALISDFHPFLFLDGKKRTFTTDNGDVFAVEHYAHLYSDYQQSAQQAGLEINAIAEPHLMIDGVNVPSVIVYRMVKGLR